MWGGLQLTNAVREIVDDMLGEKTISLSEMPYAAIQGEGIHVGKRMMFVRVQGCPVGCLWCDSQYTWSPHALPSGGTEEARKKIESKMQPMKIPYGDLVAILKVRDTERIWWTGGEPSLKAKEIVNIVGLMGRAAGYTHYLCTSGLKFNEELAHAMNWITLDIKPPSANAMMSWDNIDKYVEHCKEYMEIKIAIDNTWDDRKFAEDMVRRFKGYQIPITIQPVYASELEFNSEDIPSNTTKWGMGNFKEFVERLQLVSDNVRLGVQLHKILNPKELYGT